MSSSITIYSKVACPYCVKAKEFINSLGLSYEEIIYDPVLDSYEEMKNILIERTQQRTFPQIFVGSRFIGGYSDMLHMYDTQSFHTLCEKELNIYLNRDYDF